MEGSRKKCPLPAYANPYAKEIGANPYDLFCVFARACAAYGRCITFTEFSVTRKMKSMGGERVKRFIRRLERTIEIRHIYRQAHEQQILYSTVTPPETSLLSINIG